jgi:hemerythrin-like domain-containing protein
MKRHQSIQPLSRQHHNGLLAVLLLRKGMVRNADMAVMQKFVLQLWEDELKEHFREEEEVLMPPVYDKIDEGLFQHMKNEHKRLQEMVGQLHSQHQGTELLKQFADLLEAHIRFEERILFPAIEEVINPEIAALLTRHLKDNNQNCMNFQPKFWE